MSEKLPSDNLWDVLNSDKTVEHFHRMIEIGTYDFHESAFAVYKTLGGVAISDLYIPEIRSIDVLDENVEEAHGSIDISSLVRIAEEIDDYGDDDELVEESQVNDMARKTIQGIRSDYDMSSDEKEHLVNQVLIKETDRIKGLPPAPKTREDLYLTVHNHPRHPAQLVPVDRLLMPSTTDVYGFEAIRWSNPELIDGVFASDNERQSLILIKAENVDEKPKPALYTPVYKGRNYTAEVQESLSAAGYKSTVIEIDDTGRPSRSEKLKVRDF